MTVIISTAKAEHAAELIDIIRASITDLCADDHNDETTPLNEWLNNKTIDNMLMWIAKPELKILIAQIDGRIAGMGTANNQGRILMNYVSPEFRFKGISKAIMVGLEAHLSGLGIEQATLESSKTALEFYQTCGWQMVKTTDDKIEMIKPLKEK